MGHHHHHKRREENMPPQAYQGYQNNQGFQGYQNNQGYENRQGYQNSQGYQNYQNNQGFQGNQGNQGFQNFQESRSNNQQQQGLPPFADLLKGIDMNQIQAMLQNFNLPPLDNLSGSDRSLTILNSIKPFLPEERCRMIDEIIKIYGLSRSVTT